MPTNQPSSAPQNDKPRPTDDLNAPAVLHDESLDQPAGGGGLGGVDAGAGVRATAGAATPNSPIDATLPHDIGGAVASAEARARATAADPPEPGHGSR